MGVAPFVEHTEADYAMPIHLLVTYLHNSFMSPGGAGVKSPKIQGCSACVKSSVV